MKRILLVAAFILVAISASAQKAGITAGFTTSELKVKEVKEALESNRVSEFNIGIVYNYPLALGLAIQPGILYSMKGTSLEALKTVNLKTEYSYIEVPVQIQWGVDLIALRPYAFVEPFAGLAIGAKIKGSENKSIIQDLDSKLEYGLGVGFGLELIKRLQVSAKYFWNFEDCGFNNFTGSIKEAVTERDSFSGVTVSLAFLF